MDIPGNLEQSQNSSKVNFIPFLQPIIYIATGEIKGYEVLTRSKGVDNIEEYFRTVSPAAGASLTLNMLLITIKRFKETPVPLQFNLSARQICLNETVKMLGQILMTIDYPKSYLTCELVEYDDKHGHELSSVMYHLSELGLKFSLDDFGTTNNSYQRLFNLPISQIKVDRFMIQDIAACEKQRFLAKHFIEMTPLFDDAELVFEGIETQSQRDEVNLLSRGKPILCQGYLFAKPQPFNQIDPKVKSILLKEQKLIQIPA
ncbi:EAL domain-containing protein [Vibrio chagasii]|nr:EAL domain-containing protein [Vibrio chagasii]CAH6946925.1 EAL domain-containing protein [Vibrio chagasii]